MRMRSPSSLGSVAPKNVLMSVTCSADGHASSTIARYVRRAGRERAHDRVADVAGARLHPLRHRRLVAVPVAVERLVAHARGLVEHGERHDAGGALAVGPVARRGVLVVAVVAVQRLGHEVAGAADAGRGENRLVLRRGCRARRPRSTRSARTGSSSPGIATIDCTSRVRRRRRRSAARAASTRAAAARCRR